MAKLLAPVPYEELPLGTLDRQRVEALWRYRAAASRRQRVLPDGRMDLVVHGTLDAAGHLCRVTLAVAGPADTPGSVALSAARVSMGVRFRIGWGGLCLGIAPASLRNRVLVGAEAERLLGTLARPILASRSLADLQRALVDAASAMAARAQPTAGQARALQAIEALVRGSGQLPAGLAEAVGTNERSLRRDVLQAVGLPLRSLAGILRFQRAMAMLETGAAFSLGEIALNAGYSDQAHMTREFRRFGGFTPALPQPVPVVRVS